MNVHCFDGHCFVGMRVISSVYLTKPPRRLFVQLAGYMPRNLTLFHGGDNAVPLKMLLQLEEHTFNEFTAD